MPPVRSLRTGLLPAVHGVCWTWIVRTSAGYVEQIARLELTAGADWHVLGRVRLRASQRGVDGLAVGAVGGLNQTG